jgi:Skp family chaperone for outer membrane proteins
MQKAKFWLTQIVVVAFVSMVFGAPAMAHGDRHHKWSKKSSNYKAYKAEKYHNKLNRKIAKYENLIKKEEAKNLIKKEKVKKQAHHKHSKKWMKWNKKRMQGFKRKLARYEAELANHMDKYHQEVAAVVPAPVVPAPVVTVPVVTEDAPPECTDLTEPLNN